MQINRNTEDSVGLFAGNSGSIRNIELENPEVVARNEVGALVGFNHKSIINSGVVGGFIRRTTMSGLRIGGLIGRSGRSGVSGNADIIVVNSYASGNIKINGMRDIGGVCGENSGRIINSYAYVTVSGNSVNADTGGLAGESIGNESGIVNSYATGSVVSGSVHSGGLLGARDTIVTNSYSIAVVESKWSRFNW